LVSPLKAPSRPVIMPKRQEREREELVRRIEHEGGKVREKKTEKNKGEMIMRLGVKDKGEVSKQHNIDGQLH
jgi:hypothetical protein